MKPMFKLFVVAALLGSANFAFAADAVMDAVADLQHGWAKASRPHEPGPV